MRLMISALALRAATITGPNIGGEQWLQVKGTEEVGDEGQG